VFVEPKSVTTTLGKLEAAWLGWSVITGDCTMVEVVVKCAVIAVVGTRLGLGDGGKDGTLGGGDGNMEGRSLDAEVAARLGAADSLMLGFDD
jgi:hypothetical protein